MADHITLNLRRTSDGIVFALDEAHAYFVTLMVLDSAGEVMWELYPECMQSVPFTIADFSATEVRSGEAEAFVTLLEERSDDDLRAHFPHVREIVYGVRPDGYVEANPARALVAGVEYGLLVMGPLFQANREFVY